MLDLNIESTFSTLSDVNPENRKVVISNIKSETADNIEQRKSQNSKKNLCEEKLQDKNNDDSVINDSDELEIMPSPGNVRKLERDIKQKSEDLKKCRLLNLKLQEH